MNTQNVPVQRILLSKVHVTYRTRMSLDPGVSGDMVKVNKVNNIFDCLEHEATEQEYEKDRVDILWTNIK